jgi:hypothetical protein
MIGHAALEVRYGSPKTTMATTLALSALDNDVPSNKQSNHATMLINGEREGGRTVDDHGAF